MFLNDKIRFRIDYYETGRKTNSAIINVEIAQKNDSQLTTELLTVNQPFVLSMSGEIWQPSGHDIDCGGQMLDEFLYYSGNKKLKRLIEIWKNYHLNDMIPGTEPQMEALKECESSDFKDRCNFLKDKGLYNDRGYKFGHGWLVRPLPSKILPEVQDLVQNLKKELRGN